MESQEIRVEKIRQLQELLRKPGWEILLHRLAEVCSRKEREKSTLLRKNEIHRAILLQGEIDGLGKTADYPQHYINELKNLPEE